MKVFASPSRYIQGENALFEHAKELLTLGSKPLLFCDTRVLELVGKRFMAYLTRYGMRVVHTRFSGQASEHEFTRVLALAEAQQVDMIIGLGGGKTIDSAKVVADLLGLPIVVAPTIASTGAPASALSVIYTDEGNFQRYLFHSRPPELVLVDSKVIAKAPKRLLASGIANGLATWLEVRATQQSDDKTMFGNAQSLATFAVAQQCERTLFADSLAALQACERQLVTRALENVIEVNTLLSGISFEAVTATMPIAHAVCNGFTIMTGNVHQLTYGEKVAYGTLVQLFLEQRSVEELNRYIHFYQTIQMPTTLERLHLENASYDALFRVSQQAIGEKEHLCPMSPRFSADEVVQAILAVDQYVKNLDR
ncbi:MULTISPECIES: glycerol dehydrogenase [unclassified Streptococcus]|uniref:glycerol dehydrogenase n=1 Tax=unclassified Streptococcus TaxID=2608887 RepID=UPI00107172B4|nr:MULTISPECIES: glycerol dehydrogenase [unclassified Streptococcus]MBF0788069.1 glycerol dehydrogenase [Streptococcus sp. 19428wC2_LYSM12]MCQ9211389.1 glycerol dehydrogenase [Streptococcus sp. B01]MCQ9214701.1 glycerol dehydrogenase [Streptococcus sp. O1]TFV04882.1 glycerol dehydrogenase [Streptococcus sp. LYSM12]